MPNKKSWQKIVDRCANTVFAAGFSGLLGIGFAWTHNWKALPDVVFVETIHGESENSIPGNKFLRGQTLVDSGVVLDMAGLGDGRVETLVITAETTDEPRYFDVM